MESQVIFNFKAKRVLVTGGTQGIGLGIANAFYKAGADVVITGTRDKSSDYDTDLSAFSYIPVNLSRALERVTLADQVGDIDILINNAGVSNSTGGEFEMDGFRHTLEVDLVAPADLAFRFSKSLTQRRGAIVNIGSAACFLAIRSSPAYTAAKAGLLGLTRALADKWAPKGIRVNLVAPGYVNTQLVGPLHDNEEFSKSLISTLPIPRWGEPEDIAPTVLFLASDSASYITGQSILVDGGLVLR